MPAKIDDAARLAQANDVWPAGLCELGQFAQNIDGPRWQSLGITRNIISLAYLVETYLEKPIYKGSTAHSDWSKPDLADYLKRCSPLKSELTADAANDCYASWKIFQVLYTLRQLTSDPPIGIPSLVDYRVAWAEKVRANTDKTRRRLVRAGRRLVRDGRHFQDMCMQNLSKI